MANIKSQIKRNRQNDRRRQRNRVYRGEARTAVKQASAAIAEGAPASREALLKAISTLDRAAEKGVLHKNNVARRKSRMMKRFNAMKPAEARIEEPKVEAPVEVEAKAAPARKKAAAPKKAAAKPAAAKKAETKKAPAKKAEKKTTATKKPATRKKAAPKE